MIGTRWIFRNKIDEDGNGFRNKARLVEKGYNQYKGINFDETYAIVPRLEAMNLSLSLSCTMGFKLFQMNANSAFLNSYIKDKVFVEQPLGFENSSFLNHVFKLKRLWLAWNKLLELGIIVLASFCLKIFFKQGRLIKPFSSKNLSMTSYLVLLTNPYVNNFLRWCRMSLRCQWWESFNIF